VVLGAKVEALEASRAESDEMINTLSAEEFSKFAASDVADALKFVSGVNVVEGQFAIIRGLEDRYSSTLYNSAPIPSPDPNSQSVQLDLFPSEIVNDLVVAKNSAAEFLGGYKGGELEVLTWNGTRLEPRWNVKDLPGPILDIQASRPEKAGSQINGLVKVPGGLFSSDAVRVEKYQGK
jgi:hypothetical protein